MTSRRIEVVASPNIDVVASPRIDVVASPRIDMVFFDAGETLIHPHPSFPEVFAAVCREGGYEVAPGEVAALQERLAPHLVDLAVETGVETPTLSARESEMFWSHLYRTFLGELGIDDAGLVKRLFARFTDIATYRLFDDALPVLTELAEGGYRLGLISNFEGWLEKMLVELEVGHLFEATVISGVDGIEKPDPAIYRLALERGRVAPAQAVHVGDSMKLDIEPAHATGIQPILLDRVGRYDGRGDGGCPTISSLKELPAVLSNL